MRKLEEWMEERAQADLQGPERSDWLTLICEFKFKSALEAIPLDDPIRQDDQFPVIPALARTFGDSGYFDGDMMHIVDTAVVFICELASPGRRRP